MHFCCDSMRAIAVSLNCHRKKWVQHRFYTVHGSQEKFKYIMKNYQLHGHKWDERSKVIWKVKLNMVYGNPMSNRKIFTQCYQGQISCT